MNNNFFDFLSRIGFDKSQTRIEKYRLDGTSNYLISLNHSGITWAVAIRLPAMGTEYSKFEKEKIRAVDTAEFLVEHFGKGIALSNNVTFRFEGNSSLVPYDSIMEFFAFQNTLLPLVEEANVVLKIKPKTVDSLSYPGGIDHVKNIPDDKKKQIKKYLSEYRGNFFVSKGAPASETLDDYWEMVFDVTHALSVLHANSGLNSLIPLDNVLTLAKEFDDELTKISSVTNFSEGTSVYESFQKHQEKRNKTNDSNITELIKKELLLRTKTGKELLSRLVLEFEKTLKEGKSHYSCFTHNDPHCENFVIVKYLYEIKQNNHQYIDREFVNSILDKVGDAISIVKYLYEIKQNNDREFSIVYNKDDNSLLYRKFEAADIGASNVNIIYPGTRYDIHLIDIDDATGITQDEHKMYIYDLLIYALSVQNLSSIKGGKMQANDIIRAYYEYRGK
jgi:hypothetical protein